MRLCVSVYFCVSDSGPLDRRGRRAGKSTPAVSLLGQRRPPQRGRFTHLNLVFSEVTAAPDNKHRRRWINKREQRQRCGLTLSYSRPDGFQTLPDSSKSRFLSFLRSVRFTQNVFYLSGSEVSLNIMLLNVGFHSCLSAGLGGQPADHMELLVLQLSRPQSKFKLLLPLLFPTQLHPCISLRPVVFERQRRSSSQGGNQPCCCTEWTNVP